MFSPGQRLFVYTGVWKCFPNTLKNKFSNRNFKIRISKPIVSVGTNYDSVNDKGKFWKNELVENDGAWLRFSSITIRKSNF